MIRVENVTKSFGDIQAVRGVAFDAEDGVITGLLGPNGAGKSTTMRIIAGALQPDTGAAYVDGHHTTTATTAAQARLGVLPDTRGLYPRLTARENVRYFGQLRGLQGPSLDARIAELADLLEMADFMDRRTEGFSSGQQVKVAIARALVHDPHNVMLDEPTNGLDVMATRAMRGVIRQLKVDGRCVLFSSHIMQEVAALCDRIVIIAHGKIAAAGSPDQLRAMTGEESLEDAFVAIIGTSEGLE